MKKVLLSILVLFSLCFANAQTNVRAWYADAQVWVVWEVELPLPQTYAVFAKQTAFSNTADALPLGRIFRQEYLPAALKQQVDTLATFRIPDGQGGSYQLAQNEGLFVATPHQSGTLFLAVVAEGETAVTTGQNITAAAVPFQYNPVADPVACHLQATFPSPFAPNFTCQAYMMWADGRQNHWEGRPDFPIMANAAKNGMPSLFMVSAPTGLDTTQAFPLTVWLHGGGGEARQSLAGSRPIVGISPAEGIMLAHDDGLVGWRDNIPPNLSSPSWHFGWRKNWDPFTPSNLPTGPDTVINYTQRRYRWIDEWIIRHFNVDTTRISLNGHSMGGAGTTALAKCFPKHYASATIFNNGFGGPENDQSVAVFGSSTDDYYTNLTNRAGGKVKFRQLWNIIDNTSPERDWPPMRVYHSKNDDNGTMRWDAYVVENYRKADSLGMGVQLYWSERAHGIDEGPDYNDHWHNGNLPSQQTGYDNTAFEEAHFDSDDWLPAFFNHRLQPTAGNPGDGTLGTGANGVGDDWGTWGGYHRWEDARIEQDCWGPGTFYATLYLEDDAVFGNDNCPTDSLISDLYVRRLPYEQATYCDFGSNPQAGWFASLNSFDFSYFQNLETECVGDDLMKFSDVKLFKKGIRKLEISICLIVPTTSVGATPFTAALQPNPAHGATNLSLTLQRPSALRIRIMDASGRQFASQQVEGQAGENRVPLEIGGLPNGLYFVQVVDEQGSAAILKLVVSN
jgi:hypothetical protein